MRKSDEDENTRCAAEQGEKSKSCRNRRRFIGKGTVVSSKAKMLSRGRFTRTGEKSVSAGGAAASSQQAGHFCEKKSESKVGYRILRAWVSSSNKSERKKSRLPGIPFAEDLTGISEDTSPPKRDCVSRLQKRANRCGANHILATAQELLPSLKS